MTRTVRSLMALVAVVCALVFAPAVLADSQVRIVRLSYVDGNVQIDRNIDRGFEKAIVNMPIVQGAKLSTGDNARAEVEFEDGSTIHLAANTLVEFTELGLRDSGGKVSAVEVKNGTAYFDISPKKDDEFRVAFAGDQVTLDRGARFRVNVSDTQAQLAVFKGDLKIMGTEEVAVKKGQTFTLDLENAKFEVASGVAEDSMDNWVKSREQYRNTYAANQSYGAPYSGYYGLDDLNYYGNYYYQPSYGWLWRPYYTGYGWDPFYDGAWCWYPSFGYTWVSNYPWGWIPYRYGSWVYINGWGWGWMPGGWNNWVTVPSVINPPPSYRLPVAPRPIAPVNTAGGTAGPRVPSNPTVWIRARQPRTPDQVGSGTVATTPTRSRTVPDSLTRPSGSTLPARPTYRSMDTDTFQRGRQMSGAPAPTRVGPSTQVDRPSGATQMDRPAAPRMERPDSAPRMERPSVASPRMDAPRMDRPSAPMSAPRMDAPRMEAPRSAPPPSAPSAPSAPASSGRPPRG